MQKTSPSGGGRGAAGKEFRPFVADGAKVAEFTVKAVVLGAFFAVLFGAATVYLALRAGVTVSASIPIAVLSIAVFKKVGSTILENNIVQTIGSAGESVAAGVVFTVTGFLFLSAAAGGEAFFRYWPIMMLSLAGGILGVLMMIPLRRALIVQEHGNLTYPEGTACAEVLVAGEKGGEMARLVFGGLWAAMIYKAFNTVLGFFKEIPSYVTGRTAALPNATVNCEIVPEYLGVGYIIGPRVAGIMVSGSILGWVALTPLLSMFVPESQLHGQLRSLGFTQHWIETHGLNEQFYRGYIRLIGAGAVAMAGIMSLARTMPTIYSSFRDSVRSLRRGAGAASARRTERDIPINVVAIGSLVLALAIALFMPGLPTRFPGSLLLAVLIIAFGFFFVTVSSRIVGIIGTTSNPISGMTIATIMGTCMLFIAVGWAGDTYQTAALVIGAIVSIAAANGGATSQDLKTGYIVGATPWRQQIGFIIGVVASAFAIGGTLFLMHHSPSFGPIGSDKLPAPQGTLMATLIQGILGQKLQWGFVFVGAGLAVAIQVMGISALAWAVGAYLPLSTTMPIFVGGVIRFIVERMTGREEQESEVSSGMLYSTGLVAGGSVAGVLIAGLSMIEWNKGKNNALAWIQGHAGHLAERQGRFADLVALIAFGGLCYLLFRTARKKIAGLGS